MPENSILEALKVSRYDRRKMFVTFLILMIALTIDVSISNIADILTSQTVTFWDIALFIAISDVYAVGQYLILGMVKAKNKESKIKSGYSRITNNIVTIVQYILTAIIVFVVLQIGVTSHYYSNLLSAATAISYGLAILLMSILVYRLFSWFRLNKSLVVLLYGLAVAAIIVNAADTIVYLTRYYLANLLLSLQNQKSYFRLVLHQGLQCIL
jgi:hypothetical protein